VKFETVELVVAQRRDRNNNPVGPQAANIPISRCVLWPRASSELSSGETGVEGENVAMFDTAKARQVRYKDHLMIRGEEHAVTEPPQRYIGKRILVKTQRITI
jgi:hypothetical protein